VQPRNRSARVIANDNNRENFFHDVIERTATTAAKFDVDVHINDTNTQALTHMQIVDEGLRVEDFRSFGVETLHRQTHSSRSPSFDNSLPESTFEMTLVGGTISGWVSTTSLRSAGLLDTVRKLFKKKKLKEKNDERTPSAKKVNNTKRTPDKSAKKANNAKRTPDMSAKKASNAKRTPDKSAKKASDAKRTPAGLNASYKKHTPEQKEGAKRRLQDQRADQDEFDGKDREKLLVALRAGMETDAHNWPNAVFQELDLDHEYRSSICGEPEMTSCRRYQSKINNASLQKCACAVCWELVFKKSCEELVSDDTIGEFKDADTIGELLPSQVNSIMSTSMNTRARSSRGANPAPKATRSHLQSARRESMDWYTLYAERQQEVLELNGIVD
jgi:hypothetical protein